MKLGAVQTFSMMALAVMANCALVVPLIAGCDSGGPTPCTDDVVPGISIKVSDAQSLELAECGAEVWIVGEAFTERLNTSCDEDLPDSLRYPWLEGAFEQPGIYTITVEQDGFQSWSRSGIVVLKNDCHVQTVRIEALLDRE